MSRIGNKIIEIPAGVTLTVSGNNVNVKGPKGELNVAINNNISINVEGNICKVVRANEEKQTKQNHGTTRANLHNAIVGVSEGYTKKMVMVGIGYRAVMKGNDIVLYAGYSHTVTITPEPLSKISIEQNKQNQTEITVTGISKQAVGQTSALIREVRPPEPYLGKGIRYIGEHITLKEGKKAAAGGKK